MEPLPIPLPAPRALTVLVVARPTGDVITQLLAELALRGPITVLDGGNRFPGYRLLQLLRRRLADPAAAARQITIQRAFTCHQMLALLESIPTPAHPVMLLDPLATFYDENVPLPEVRRLSATCLRHMERLRQHAPVLVVVPPAPAAAGRAFLLENLCQAASGVHLLERPAPVSPQPALL